MKMNWCAGISVEKYIKGYRSPLWEERYLSTLSPLSPLSPSKLILHSFASYTRISYTMVIVSLYTLWLLGLTAFASAIPTAS